MEVNIEMEGEADKFVSSAAWVEITLPDGSRPEYLARTIYMPQGQGIFRFTPALNSPVGQWTITVTECISGFHEQHKLDVR